jgi:hypothetical protein
MRAADPGAKAIVFSQFTSMLELIGFRLEQVWFTSLSYLVCASSRGVMRWCVVSSPACWSWLASGLEQVCSQGLDV